jgi:molecular chaperone DnaK
MSRFLFSKRANQNIRKNVRFQLCPQREFIPVLIGGLAVLAVGTLARYIVRTKIRVDEEEEISKGLNPEDDSLGNVNSLAKILQVKSIGVDIGSAYCRLAIRNGEKTNVLENSSGQYGMPAMILNTADGVVVGSFAKQNCHMKASSTLSTFQILAGLPPAHPYVQQALQQLQLSAEPAEGEQTEVAFSAYGESFTASRMRSIFSKELFTTAASKDLEAALLPAILSVPNYFSDDQKLAAVESARTGGLNIIYAIPDALSSVLGMHYKGLCELEGRYVVVDVGGSLTQLSVLDCKEVHEEPTLIAERTIFSGSDAINDIVAKFVAEKFEADTGINLLADNMAKQRLYDSIESLKVDLSLTMSSSLNVPYITADAQGQPKHLDLDISRSTFENLISAHTEIFASPMKDMLAEAGVVDPASQIKGQIVVGGGARVPIVLKTLTDIFGEATTTMCEKEPEEINVVGSAQYPKHY